MLKKSSQIAVISAALLSSGCASIISDSNYPVTVNSTPDGAQFEIQNTDSGMTIMKGTTPSTVTLDASDGFFDGADYSISFSKDGYNDTTYPLNSKLDGWYIGNLLFGGVLGILIVDPATGAMWKLDEGVAVSLSEAPTKNGDTLSVLTLDQVPDHLHDQLQPINSH